MGIEEFSYRISFSIVAFLLFFTLSVAEGQFHLIGTRHPIKAAPGDDVVLPCHVEPKLNVVGLTVEWSRPDRVEYVHLYRHSIEVPDMKIPSYIGRTALFTDGLREGNISLRITNVTLEDEGRYRCFIPKLKSQTKSSVVRLIVDPNLATTRTTGIPLHLKDLQTRDRMKEIDAKADLSRRSRLIPLVVFCVLVLLCVAIGARWFTESWR